MIVLVEILAPRRFNSLDRKEREEHALRRRDDLLVVPLVDRKAEHASLNPVEVDLHVRRLLRFAVLRASVIVVAILMNRLRLRHERRRHVVAQRYDEWPAGLREAQVELQRIVDRVEVARRDEIQILAVRIPDRRLIRPQRRRNVVDLSRANLDDANDRRALCRRPNVSQEASVGREGQTGDAMRRAGVEDANLSVVEVRDAQLVAVVRKSDDVVGGRADHVGNAADVSAGDQARLARRVGPVECDLLVSVDVGDRSQPFAVVQPLREPAARLAPHAVADDGPFEKRHRKRLTARIESDLRPLWVRPELLERFRRVLEAACELRRGGVRLDLNARDAAALNIEQLDVSTGGVDYLPAVGGGKARVVLALIGVAANAASVEFARIDVADAFVIGQEVDAVSDPHRPAGIPVG